MAEISPDVSQHLKWLDKTSDQIAKKDPEFPQRVAFWQELFATMQGQLEPDKFVEAAARSKAISEHEATVDSLTRLTNLGGFKTAAQDLFVEAKASGQPLSIAVIDLVNLGRLNNEALGHTGADQLLSEMAKIFAGWRMPGDVFARLHGDEFACLASDTNKRELTKVLQAVEIEVMELFAKKGLDKLNFPVGISYGAVEWNSKDTLTKSLKKADVLMYKHKATVKAGNHG